jgi:putative transposase
LLQKERQDMKGKRYSPEQIIKILREAERADSARDVIRRYDITEQTFYRWKKVYAGMEVADIKRLKAIQEENARLKRLVADQALKISLLEDVNSKKW